MRTKLVLTTAALGVAGSLGAVAQVYSVNAVGYINVTVPANQFVIAANQLNTGGNTIAQVIPTTVEGTTIYKYGAAGFEVPNAFEFGEWGNPAQVLAPGDGFFVKNNSASPVTITFVGEVPQGASLSTALRNGLNLTASQVPQAGRLQADLGYVPTEGDIVYKWNTATQAYAAPNGFEFGEWAGGDPQLTVGEGFFLQKNGAGSWTRSFSVNN
jgi:hypothetical protein